MTIDGAVRFLRAIRDDRRERLALDESQPGQEALNLGIEALKRIKQDREFCPATKGALLPGETKE